MVKWSECGFIIDKKTYGENNLIIQVFTKTYGRYAGLLRGGQSKKYASTIQIGNLVNIDWNARLEQHLGQFKIELLISYASRFFTKKIHLNAMITIAAYLKKLPERENNHQIFEAIECLMPMMENSHNQNEWLAEFVRFENLFLAKSGFGIQIHKCALTNTTQEINYVSPKSAKAVCDKIALPYKKKLLAIPQFLKNQKQNYLPQNQEINNGLKFTEFFIRKFIFAKERKIPISREILAKTVQNNFDKN